MIKSLMVCLDGSAHGDVAADYAVHLARQLKARLLGLHVLDSRMLEGPLLSDISGWIGAMPYGTQLAQFRDLMQQKGEAVLQAFHARCETAGLTADSQLKMGHPPRVILDAEAQAELVILGQKGEHADSIGELTGSTGERVIRHSLKPCLVTPAAFQPITRVLLGFDGSDTASKALREAVEFAQALGAPLTLVSVAADAESVSAAQEIAAAGLKLLQAHECPAQTRTPVGPTAQTLLRTAEEEGAGLLVVGAYGHSRVREMILGSTTTQLVSRARLPVLLVR